MQTLHAEVEIALRAVRNPGGFFARLLLVSVGTVEIAASVQQPLQMERRNGQDRLPRFQSVAAAAAAAVFFSPKHAVLRTGGGAARIGK